MLSSCQTPVASEDIGPRVDPAIVTLLNGHALKLLFKYLSLYSKTLMLFLQWLVVNAFKKNCKNAENVKHLCQHYQTILQEEAERK